jgi:UDP-N-acetylglucosamine acyltransferase
VATTIHPSAHVSSKAELGCEVVVGPGAVIEDRVRIGDGTRIGPYAVVMDYTTLGRECRIHAHAVLGDWPQDAGFQGQTSYLNVGDRCLIREGVTLHRGTKLETATIVGDGCFLMANSHVAHNCRLGRGVILANGALLAGYVEVGDRAFISGNVLIHQFCRVGRLAMLAGGGAFNKDVPPFCTTQGVARNAVVGLNVVGMRRAGLEPAVRLEIRRAFKVLYRSTLNVTQAVERLRREFDSEPVRELAAFIEDSKRGICHYFGGGDSGDGEGNE